MPTFQINPLHSPEARGRFSADGNTTFAGDAFVAFLAAGYTSAGEAEVYATLTPADAREFGQALIDAAAEAEDKAPVKLTVTVPRKHAAAARSALRAFDGAVIG